MKWRVSFNVPQGTPSGAVRNAITGVEYEADEFIVGGVADLTLWKVTGHVPAMKRTLVICFAPGTWRTITPVGAAETPEASA